MTSAYIDTSEANEYNVGQVADELADVISDMMMNGASRVECIMALGVTLEALVMPSETVERVN